MYGCNSNVAYIDLTTGKINIEIIPDDILLQYLGGRGINSYLLLKNFKKLDSPLDPDNIIIISAGLFVNTSAPSSGRTCISTLMNAEGTNFGDSSIGGRFSVAMKSAGIDTLYITGHSNTLCYLLIENGHISIEKASHLKHLNTYEVDILLKEKYTNARILSIGLGGEKLSPYANVVSEDRAAGDAAGNVWGSKNLKAVVAVQSPNLNLAKNQEEFSSICNKTEEYLKSHPVYEEFRKYGTTLLVDIHNRTGNFPMNNWKEGSDDTTALHVNHDAVYNRSLPQLKPKYFEKEKFGCSGCALEGCSHIYNVSGTQTCKIEYESLNCLSGKIGRDSLQSVLRLNTWCNQVGIDFIRVTGFLSAAIDSGNISIEDLDYEDFEHFFKEIAIRPPKQILEDPRFKERLVQSKGKYASSFDPRANLSSALAAATSTRGFDHLRSLSTVESYYSWYLSKGYNPKEYILNWLGVPKEVYDLWETNLSLEPGYQGKEYLTWFYERNNTLADILGLCKFHTSWRFGLGFEKLAEMLTPLIGIQWKWNDLFNVADEVLKVERKLLKKYKQKDTLPDFFFTEGTSQHPPLDKKKFNALLYRFQKLCGYEL